MTLSSSSAQTREIGELRNQLKWMDEERRKSGRKLTELEQRLAQQGRELAERDRKIQELEWHIANVAERLERIPDEDPKAAAQEQRLQDLEWHLSNLSAQLARQPDPEQERARLAEEVGQTLADAQQRLQAEQAATESRWMAELAALRETEDRLMLQFQAAQESLPAMLRLDERLAPVVGRQEEQAESLGRVNEQFAVLRESVDALSAQLRERTVTLAAESQSNYAALANRVQDYLDAQAEQFETRTAIIETSLQERLEAVTNRAPDTSPEIVLLGAQMEQVEQRAVDLESRLLSLFDETRSDLAAQVVALQGQLAAVREELYDSQGQTGEVQGRFAAVDEQFGAVQEQVAGAQARFGAVDEQLATLLERVAGLQEQVAGVQEQYASLQEQAAGAQSDGAALTARQTRLEQSLAHLDETVSKLGNARELMALFDRVEQELDLRQAEDVRLANLISTQEGRFAPVVTALDEVRETSLKLLSRMSDVEHLTEESRRAAQDFNDNWKPIVTEVSRRVGPLAERLTNRPGPLGDVQSEMRETLSTLAEETQRSRVETSRQIEAWQATIDEHKDTIERFTQQWLTLSNQYKEARMAVQNFAHWQKQLEQQKREASEMLRFESNRMQSRWDGFLLEIQEKLKNFELELAQKWQAFELENEQKWAVARRSEQVWREELGAVDELIQKLQQDNRNLIWRVQTAQADAIKKWPRLLMEEVEKAVELNPTRRLSPATTAARANMSVADAIEQGLIKIDYSDEASSDL